MGGVAAPATTVDEARAKPTTADTLVSTTSARLCRDWLSANGFDVEPDSLMLPPFSL
jgi:hypothetical protein